MLHLVMFEYKLLKQDGNVKAFTVSIKPCKITRPYLSKVLKTTLQEEKAYCIMHEALKLQMPTFKINHFISFTATNRTGVSDDNILV